MALEEQGAVVQISRLFADLFTYYKRHTRCLVFTFQSELLSYFAFYSNNKTQTLVNIQLQKNWSCFQKSRNCEGHFLVPYIIPFVSQQLREFK